MTPNLFARTEARYRRIVAAVVSLFRRKPVRRDEQGRFVSESHRRIRKKAADMYRERGMAVPEVLLP